MKKTLIHIFVCLLAVLALSSVSLTAQAASRKSPPVITKQPENVSGYEGEIVRFSVEASGSRLSYQWQWSDDGSKWYASSIQKALGSVKVRPVNNGRQYRCVITDRYGKKAVSDAMTITMRKTLNGFMKLELILLEMRRTNIRN